jgi:hypothetical protein
VAAVHRWHVPAAHHTQCSATTRNAVSTSDRTHASCVTRARTRLGVVRFTSVGLIDGRRVHHVVRLVEGRDGHLADVRCLRV